MKLTSSRVVKSLALAVTLAGASTAPALAAGSAAEAAATQASAAKLQAASSGMEIIEQGRADSAGSAGAQSTSETAARAGCWYVTWSRWYNNIFGMRLVTYYQRMDWCGSGGKITSWSRNRYGTASMPGWSFKGNIGSQVTGGRGSSYVRSWTQGHFCLVEYFSCVQNKYPWIDMRVTAGGGVSGDYGG